MDTGGIWKKIDPWGPQHKISSRELMGSESFGGAKRCFGPAISHFKRKSTMNCRISHDFFCRWISCWWNRWNVFFFLEVPVGRPSVTMEVVVGYLVILMVLVEIPWVTSWKVKIVTHSGFPELNLPRWCSRNLVHQLKGSWHLMILLILRLIHPLRVFFCC